MRASNSSGIALRSLRALFATALGFGLAPGVARADSQVVVDAAGHAIGYLAASNSICQDATTVPVYSATQYLACIRSDGPIDVALSPPGTLGLFEGTFYESADCSGGIGYATQFQGVLHGGIVVATPLGLRGAFLGASAIGLTFLSRLSGTPDTPTCTPLPFPADYLAMPLVQIVPASSGFSAVPYVGPLAIRTLPDAALNDVIFFDTFDARY